MDKKKKRQKRVSRKEGRNCGWFSEVAKSVWDKGNLLLLHQFCWKDTIAFDIKKLHVQMWATSPTDFLATGASFFPENSQMSGICNHLLWQYSVLLLILKYTCLPQKASVPVDQEQEYQEPASYLTITLDPQPRCSGNTSFSRNINLFAVTETAR